MKDAVSRGVVVGHDHRHNSERWAQLTAAAFMANGMKVYLLNGLVHTPMYLLLPAPYTTLKLNIFVRQGPFQCKEAECCLRGYDHRCTKVLVVVCICF